MVYRDSIKLKCAQSTRVQPLPHILKQKLTAQHPSSPPLQLQSAVTKNTILLILALFATSRHRIGLLVPLWYACSSRGLDYHLHVNILSCTCSQAGSCMAMTVFAKSSYIKKLCKVYFFSRTVNTCTVHKLFVINHRVKYRASSEIFLLQKCHIDQNKFYVPMVYILHFTDSCPFS